MRRKGGEGGIWVEEAYGKGVSFFERVLLDLWRGVWVDSQEGLVHGAPVCWGFWAWGPGYPYDILELGSCPRWQGGNKVWVELVSALGNNKAAGWTTGSTEKLASRRGKIVLFCYKKFIIHWSI